jgi:hypothetical protein
MCVQTGAGDIQGGLRAQVHTGVQTVISSADTLAVVQAQQPPRHVPYNQNLLVICKIRAACMAT